MLLRRKQVLMDEQSTEASSGGAEQQQQFEATSGTAGPHRNCFILRPSRRDTRSTGSSGRRNQRPPPGLKMVPVQLLQQQQFQQKPQPTNASLQKHPSSKAITSTASNAAKPFNYQCISSESSAASLLSAKANDTVVAKDASAAAPPSQSLQTIKPIESLLQLPKPQDRSSKLQFDRRKRLGGKYEGELEPVGRRGDEAVINIGSVDNEQEQDEGPPLLEPSFALPRMRDFSKAPVQVIQESPLPPSRVRQTRAGAPPAPLNLLPAQSDSHDNDNKQASLLILPPRPKRVTQLPPVLSPSNSSSASSSFNDDDDVTPLQLDPTNGSVVLGVSSSESQQPMTTTSHDDDNEPTMKLNSIKSNDNAIEVSPQHSPNDLQSNSPSNTPANVDKSNIHSLNQLAMQHVQANEYELAVDCFQRVLTLLQHDNLHHQQPPRYAEIAACHHNLGTLHAKRSQTVDSVQKQERLQALALREFQAAARTARDGLGKDHPNVAVSLVRVGFLLLQSKQYKNAIITFREALRIRIAAYGTPKHALVANLYNNLGVCHLHLGQFEDGLEYLQEALKIQLGLGNDNYDSATTAASEGGSRQATRENEWIQQLELADTLFNIGGLCLEWIRRKGPDTRRAMDAESAFAEALEIRLKVLGPEDPMVLQVKSLLDMARDLPRPRLHASSPCRSPRRDPLGRINGSPRSPRHMMNNSLVPASTNTPSPEANCPFDERSGQPLRPHVVTPKSEADQPENIQQSVFRTSPQLNVASIVTPATDKRATEYNDTYNSAKPRLPSWRSKSRDEGDAPLTNTPTKGFFAPHHIPESPVRSLDNCEEASSARGSKASSALQRRLQYKADASRRNKSDPPAAKKIIFSTGNSERDELMNRAKALLDNLYFVDDDDDTVGFLATRATGIVTR